MKTHMPQVDTVDKKLSYILVPANIPQYNSQSDEKTFLNILVSVN